MGLLIGNLRIFKRAVFPLGDKLVIVKIATLVQLLIDLIQAIPLDQSRAPEKRFVPRPSRSPSI